MIVADNGLLKPPSSGEEVGFVLPHMNRTWIKSQGMIVVGNSLLKPPSFGEEVRFVASTHG